MLTLDKTYKVVAIKGRRSRAKALKDIKVGDVFNVTLMLKNDYSFKVPVITVTRSNGESEVIYASAFNNAIMGDRPPIDYQSDINHLSWSDPERKRIIAERVEAANKKWCENPKYSLVDIG